MKKTDVYVVVDTPKKAKKLKKLLDMFGESYGGCTFELLENKEGDKVYFNMCSEWNTDTVSMIHRRLQEVSIKELRNILAKEHLKANDTVVIGNKIGTKWIVKLTGGKSLEHSLSYNIYNGVSSNLTMQASACKFIRYATDEEKALLDPVNNFTDSDIAIVERLHDALLDNHGYSLESKLLTDARMLANKIKSNIK